MRWRDRDHAGRDLAGLVTRHPVATRDPVVLGLPRGGMPVAAAVAATLDAPLDVLVVRKLGAPGRPELGLGAVGEDGVRVIDPAMLERLEVSDAHLAQVTAEERAELIRRVERYRGGRPAIEVEGRAVVLVDDGIATGGSVRAALDVLRARGVGQVVVAVPVAPTDIAERLGLPPDQVLVAHTPEPLIAVGAAYDDFSQTTDDEVVDALRLSR